MAMTFTEEILEGYFRRLGGGLIRVVVRAVVMVASHHRVLPPS